MGTKITRIRLSGKNRYRSIREKTVCMFRTYTLQLVYYHNRQPCFGPTLTSVQGAGSGGSELSLSLLFCVEDKQLNRKEYSFFHIFVISRSPTALLTRVTVELLIGLRALTSFQKLMTSRKASLFARASHCSFSLWLRHHRNARRNLWPYY